jgi:methylated-DNA-protein-cysteine methyltransferase-like protein
MATGHGLNQRIVATVRRVPAGAVATYGQIAAEAGAPRRARLVGQVLKTLPPGSGVPWHRVINARGELSLPVGSEAWRRQRDRLENEGIVFVGGRIALDRFRWRPSLDELLWGPPEVD